MARAIPPNVEAYAAQQLADRLRTLAADLTDWVTRIEREADDIETIHANPQRIRQPYAFAVSQALSGRLQGLMHSVTSLGAEAASVETYRAERLATEAPTDR